MFFISCNFFCSMITYISEKMKNKKTSYIWYSKNIEIFCKDISSDINLLYLKGMQFLQIFKVAAFGIKNVHSLSLHEIFYQCIYFQKILSTSSVHSNCILELAKFSLIKRMFLSHNNITWETNPMYGSKSFVINF